jgi:hypothetical protein
MFPLGAILIVLVIFLRGGIIGFIHEKLLAIRGLD